MMGQWLHSQSMHALAHALLFAVRHAMTTHVTGIILRKVMNASGDAFEDKFEVLISQDGRAVVFEASQLLKFQVTCAPLSASHFVAALPSAMAERQTNWPVYVIATGGSVLIIDTLDVFL